MYSGFQKKVTRVAVDAILRNVQNEQPALLMDFRHSDALLSLPVNTTGIVEEPELLVVKVVSDCQQSA